MAKVRSVAVVGAGPGGLFAALALRRIGVRVRVFERRAQLLQPGAGLSLWANALRALDALGLATGVIERAAVVPAMKLQNERGRVLSVVSLAPLERSLGMPTVCMLRTELVGALADPLGADAITFGRAVERVESDADGATLHLRGGQTEHADLVVGADGLHSAVRDAVLGPGGDAPEYAGRSSWRGVAEGCADALPQGIALETLGLGRRVGMFTVGGGRVYWYLARNGPTAPPGAGPSRDEALGLVEGWPGVVREVIAKTPLEQMLRTDIVDRPPAARWHRGPLVLLGDAVHPMTPDLGQGACLAIEDGLSLARHLRDAASIESALAGYEAERAPRARALRRRSRLVGATRQLGNPVLRAVRDLALRILPARAALAQVRPAVAYVPPPL
jgi:2-polyprenyl-6-methoxyphenol hydroxylase-like FAD-dependent oxidoreductase